MNRNKYKYLRQVDYKLMWNNRGRIIQVYPETKPFFEQNTRKGCSKCKKRRLGRGILSKIIELPSEGRNLELLRGVIPQGLLDLL
jgi:hypothetical protein